MRRAFRPQDINPPGQDMFDQCLWWCVIKLVIITDKHDNRSMQFDNTLRVARYSVVPGNAADTNLGIFKHLACFYSVRVRLYVCLTNILHC